MVVLIHTLTPQQLCELGQVQKNDLAQGQPMNFGGEQGLEPASSKSQDNTSPIAPHGVFANMIYAHLRILFWNSHTLKINK